MNNIPTLSQLYNQILSDLESQLNVTIPLFGKSFLRALAMVKAAQMYLHYLRLADIQKNVWIDTADPVANGGTLERFGFVKLGRYPYPATQGKYTVSVIGQAGATINAGTQFISNDNSKNPSKLFVIDTNYTCTGTSDTILLRALEAGDGSSLEITNTLTSIVPIANVDSIFTVVSETEQPQAAEDIEVYRRKGIESFRLLPQGGSHSDYRLWANEVSGVVQSYPYCASGLINQVNLYIEGDTTDGVPTPTDILNVTASIEQATATRPARKPVTDVVNYLAVIPLGIEIEIQSFSGITTEIENLIFDAVKAMLFEIRPFIAAIDIEANRNDRIDTNMIIQKILEVRPGSAFGAVTMQVESVSYASFQFDNGRIPNLVSISYV